jgi:hypothetical protein
VDEYEDLFARMAGLPSPRARDAGVTQTASAEKSEVRTLKAER